MRWKRAGRLRRARTGRDVRRGHQRVFATGGPWYGLRPTVGATRQIGGHGWGGTSVRLSLSHTWGGDKWVSVETDTNAHDYFDDCDVVDDWLAHRSARDLSPSDFPVQIEIQRWERVVLVEGQPVSFVFIGDRDSWVARGQVGERRIRVHARRFGDAELDLIEVDRA